MNPDIIKFSLFGSLIGLTYIYYTKKWSQEYKDYLENISKIADFDLIITLNDADYAIVLERCGF